MIIANNLETTERIVLPHRQKKKPIQYKWYDYVVFLGALSIIGTAIFVTVLIATIIMFG